MSLARYLSKLGAFLNSSGQVATDGLQDSAVTPTKLSQKMTIGASVASTSGAAIDFTGIPSWVKRITINFAGVSSSGANAFLIQLGTSSGVETSGYSGCGAYVGATNSSRGASFTNGLAITPDTGPSVLLSGSATLSLLGNNTWCMSSAMGRVDSYLFLGGGSKALAGALDRIRIATNGGTDTFDAGTINIIYEG